MKLTVVENQFKKFAAILGVIQGLAYLILALICIVLYNKDPPNLDYTTYWGRVNYDMFYFFLGPDLRYFKHQSLYPRTFTVFAWIYFVLHLIWIGVSVAVTGDKGVRTPKYMTAWSHCTLLISVWDLITVIILGSDYDKCLWYTSTFLPAGADADCAMGILPALVIAARGFVLWFINVGLALVLNKMSRRLKKNALAVHQNLSAPIGHPESQNQVQTPYSQSAPYITPSPQTSNKHIFELPYRAPGSYPQPLPYTAPSPQSSNGHPFENPAFRSSPTHIQSPNKNRIQFDYPVHRPEPSPKNLNRNENEFPVPIPEPDYHLNQQRTAYSRQPI